MLTSAALKLPNSHSRQYHVQCDLIANRRVDTIGYTEAPTGDNTWGETLGEAGASACETVRLVEVLQFEPAVFIRGLDLWFTHAIVMGKRRSKECGVQGGLHIEF